MRSVTRVLVGALVASLVAAAVTVYAQTPTEADFAVCNADAQVAVEDVTGKIVLVRNGSSLESGAA